MPYVRENDGLPIEIRQGEAGIISYFARQNGRRVTASAGTFTVHDYSGTQIQSGSCSLNSIDSAAATRIDCAISAISTLDEGYQCRITWTPTGGAAQLEIRTFDVVLFPYSLQLSLSDLMEIRVDAAPELDRYGQRLGYSAGDQAQEYAAAIFIERAALALDAMIRDSIQEFGGLAETQARTVSKRIGYSRPYAILNRDRLNRAGAYLALRELYQAIARAPLDGEDQYSQLYRHFKEQAALAYQAAGPIKFAAHDSLIELEEKSGIGRTTRLRRVQA